jgi:hypothetical protein
MSAPGIASAAEIFNNTNTAAVQDCGSKGAACYPQFTLSVATLISQVEDYHWYDGRGSAPGSISFQPVSGGKPYGPFAAVGLPATAGVIADWVATVNENLPAGTYFVVDSDVPTWSQNAGSGNKGFSIVTSAASSSGGGGGTPSPAPPVAPPAPAPTACSLRGGFQFLCYGSVITLNQKPVVLGTDLTLTVNAASGYSFDANTVLVLEPVSGVGLGVGLRTLCGAIGGARCPFTSGKTMTVPIPTGGVIPAGSYLLQAQNWNPSIVVGSVGVCSPTCTEADAGVVTFTSTPAGGPQIVDVVYPAQYGQIGVDFVDPTATLDKIQILPWMGYQWGTPITWDPGTRGMTSGRLFIAVGGCTPGQSYTIYLILSDNVGSADRQFSYVCQ